MKSFTLGEIANLLHADLIGDPLLTISSFASLDKAKDGDLSFAVSAEYEQLLPTTQATAVLVRKDFNPQNILSTALLRVDNPYLSLTQLMQYVSKMLQDKRQGIAQSASIAPSVVLPEDCYIGDFVIIEDGVKIAKGVSIYPHCYIGKDVTIGEYTTLYAQVSLYAKVEIGSRCIIHSGAVIGGEGFGFIPTAKGYEKIPQLGIVRIGNDVEIGSNSTIDRAMMDATILEDGVKLDNLVQIGHNCIIGTHTVISAQSGIAGSTIIGKWCRIGGQVGFAGHQKIGDYTEVGAQSGVVGNVAPNSHILGSPHMDAFTAYRSYVSLTHLPKLTKKINTIETKLSTIEETLKEKCNSKL